MEKKSNHQVNVIRVSDLLPHTNADALELIHVGGYQVVVKKGQFKAGDLAVYIQPDSVVPQTEPFKFIWENYMDITGAVTERRRRVTVRKFRKEVSEGLLLPISDFLDPWTPKLNPMDWKEGNDVSDILGISHYDPDKGRESTTGENMAGQGRRRPRSLKGWFYFFMHKFGFRKDNRFDRVKVGFTLPVYDVDAYKNFVNALEPGELVAATEKIHGSNARYIYTNKTMYAGSRTLWKSPKSTCIWRKALEQNPWIEQWCRSHEGYALYGEVVPTQTGYNYGCKEGEAKFFAFDVRRPDGTWMDARQFAGGLPDPRDLVTPPFVTSRGTRFDGTTPFIEFDPASLKTMTEGPSLVPGANHIREGVVIRPVEERHRIGLGRVLLKVVSNTFLEKDNK